MNDIINVIVALGGGAFIWALLKLVQRLKTPTTPPPAQIDPKKVEEDIKKAVEALPLKELVDEINKRYASGGNAPTSGGNATGAGNTKPEPPSSTGG